MAPSHVLVTGASGFVGASLLRRLLTDHPQANFYLLARSKSSEEAALEHVGDVAEGRIRFVTGDLLRPGLGLANKELEALTEKVDTIWHVAGATSFDASDKELVESTNIGGTGRVLELAAACRAFHCFYYMSTAYICGNNTDRVPEGAFASEVGYKNDYEASKVACEELVRASAVPYAILRPSIIIGDSNSGRAHGDKRTFYGYLLALQAAARRSFGGDEGFWAYWAATRQGDPVDLDTRLLGSADVTKNIVTLDDVINVCSAVGLSTDAVGKTFNIVNPQNLTMGQATEAIERVLRVKGFRLEPGLKRTDIPREHKVERTAYVCTKTYWPYMNVSEPLWDTTNTDALGVERVRMTDELFSFLMHWFVEDLANTHALVAQ
ncbi:MAG: SDR family oxidoreductase [Planctomycetota bacterium]|jgi:nucleoside-diphosphate-sugar epimerase